MFHVLTVPTNVRLPKQNVAEAAEAKPDVGTPDNPLSLANRYAKPGVSYSDEEIRATLREFRSQWEEDLDERLDPGS